MNKVLYAITLLILGGVIVSLNAWKQSLQKPQCEYYDMPMPCYQVCVMQNIDMLKDEAMDRILRGDPLMYFEEKKVRIEQIKKSCEKWTSPKSAIE
jgi:hypothetical protein